MIRILIADDQVLMQQGLSMILSSDQDIKVVGAVGNGQEAFDFCKREEVDVILMDIRMPVMNGVEASERIKAYNPEIKIVVLTTFNDDSYIFSTLKNGASGYLLKDATPNEIIDGVKKAYGGGTIIHADIATKIVKQLSSPAEVAQEVDPLCKELTLREQEICHYLGEGLNNKEIGDLLFISEGTVKNNITRILDKLGFRDRTQLALFAVKNHL